MKEPCLCGATDCPRCYPMTWRENILYDKYEDSDDPRPYDEWLAEYLAEEAERKLDSIEGG